MFGRARGVGQLARVSAKTHVHSFPASAAIVQNTSAFEDLGVATSGVTFFRTIGSSFGAAIFGSLFVNFHNHRMGAALAASGAPPQAVSSPAALHRQPHNVAAPIVAAYSESLTHVFLCAAPSPRSGSSWRCSCVKCHCGTSTTARSTSATGSVCPTPKRRNGCWRTRSPACCSWRARGAIAQHRHATRLPA